MAVDLWQLIERTNIRWTLAIWLIDRDISQVLQDAVLLIGCRRSLQQIWVAVDEAGVNPLGHKVRLTQQRAQETDVGSNTSDVEFLKGTASTLHGLLEILATAGHLHQQRVEVRRDFRTHGSRTVQADTSATWRTVGGQGAGIWTEAVIRVFGGNAALQRKAIELDVFLAQVQVFQGRASGDLHLGLYDIDTGDLFGHGVLYLHARVHLNEDVVAALIDQELNGASTLVVDVLTEIHRILADAVTQLRVQKWRRSNLDNLLVTTLHRAVALK